MLHPALPLGITDQYLLLAWRNLTQQMFCMESGEI